MQAGGHDEAFLFHGARVLKESKVKEIRFYDHLFSGESQDPTQTALKELIPAYYGTEAREGKVYIVMENLCKEMTAPCILDCKLGRVCWSADHPPNKVASQILKGDKTTSNLLGFRVSGEVIRDPAGTVLKSWKKAEGFFGINSGNISEAFTEFVTSQGRVRIEIVNEFLARTQQILDWFMTQKSLAFIATSVLYVYDQSAEGPKLNVRLIDFAHTAPSSSFDHSISYIDVIHGLENIIALWSRIRDLQISA